MRRLIYCSEAVADCGVRELTELVEVSRAHNVTDGVTGMLLYCNRSFLQMLEGKPEVVAATLERIKDDLRHERLRVLMDESADGRLLPGLTLGFHHVDEMVLAAEFDGRAPGTERPLASPDVVTDGAVAQRLIVLHSRGWIGTTPALSATSPAHDVRPPPG